MKRPTDDPLNDLDPDIAEVLMSRLDFRESPEDGGADEPQEEEEEPAVAVEWTPPAGRPAETSPAEARPVDSPPATPQSNERAAPAEPQASPKVVRALTGNRTHAASQEEVWKLAEEHGLTLAVAEQVAAGRMTLRSAVNLRRIRATQARRHAVAEGRSSDKRLLFLFVALLGVFFWVLFIQ